MTQGKQIVMSAASIAAAIQAVHSMNMESRQISIPDSSAYRAEAREAVSGAQAQALIRAAMAPIAKTIRVDEKLMRERYAEASDAGQERTLAFLKRLEEGGFVDVAQDFGLDSTSYGGALGCYGNCHSACHGSRGWR